MLELGEAEAIVSDVVVRKQRDAMAVGCQVLVDRVPTSEWELELSFVGGGRQYMEVISITPGLVGPEVISSEDLFMTWVEHEMDDVIRRLEDRRSRPNHSSAPGLTRGLKLIEK